MRKPSFITKFIRLFALNHTPKSRQAFKTLLKQIKPNDYLDNNDLMMLEGVLDVSSMQVRDVMIPRTQMVYVKHDATLDEIIPILEESEHSRFPVIEDNVDTIVGILLAKDLIPYLANDQKDFDMDDIMRQPIFVPESKRLNVLLQDFRQNKNHLAVVVDEYGGVSGIITIEDVLEQIVGHIEDETDIDEAAFIRQHDEKTFIVDGLTPVEEFNQTFKTPLSDEQFDTIAGIVLQQFGHMPKRNEIIALHDLQCKVLKADSRRIYLLEVTRT